MKGKEGTQMGRDGVYIRKIMAVQVGIVTSNPFQAKWRLLRVMGTSTHPYIHTITNI